MAGYDPHDPTPAATRPPTARRLRWFGLASIFVAIATSSGAGWYLNNVYSQLLRSEMVMMLLGGGLGSPASHPSPSPESAPETPDYSGSGRPFGMNWAVIIPAIVAWAGGVGLSMLVLLVGGILAAAGSRRARPVLLLAAGLILAATVGTCLALSVLVNYAQAVAWSPVRYAAVAAIQSAWGWIIIFGLAPRRAR
jgi:hypothetical protein